MKASFVQIYDKQDDAEEALGYISGAYPDHDHKLVTTSNQIQVWTKINGASEAHTFGELNDAVVFLVLSIAK